VPDGRLYTCLFAAAGHDLRPLVRRGASVDELREAIAAIWSRRADRYSELRTAQTLDECKVEMSFIGG
jgi:cyclic pyranopterin phosphate synthase